MKLVPEPGREFAAVQAVQPERDCPQFNRDGVQVDPEAVPVRDKGTDSLLLEDDVVLRDGPACLLLLALEVEVGELVRCLNQERGGPHCRLENLQIE